MFENKSLQEKCLSHIVCYLVERTLCYLEYNNFKEGVGCIEEPLPKDYRSMVLENIHNWELDDIYLTLDEWGPSVSEKYHCSINQYWDLVDRYISVSKNEALTSSLDSLHSTYEEAFAQNFREVGVKNYYQKISEEDALNVLSRKIIRNRRYDFLKLWKFNKLSLYDIQFLVEEIIRYLVERLHIVESKLLNLRQCIEVHEAHLKYILQEGYTFNPILALIKRKENKEEIFDKSRKAFSTLYRDLTFLEAFAFERKLLDKLITAFKGYSSFLSHHRRDFNHNRKYIHSALKAMVVNWTPLEEIEQTISCDLQVMQQLCLTCLHLLSDNEDYLYLYARLSPYTDEFIFNGAYRPFLRIIEEHYPSISDLFNKIENTN